MSDDSSKAAAALGRKGGAARSEAKTAAVRANGAKGGRPSLDRDSLIVAIIQAKPQLARIGNLAMGGSKGAIKQLAEQACGMGGGYLTPSQWLLVSENASLLLNQ